LQQLVAPVHLNERGCRARKPFGKRISLHDAEIMVLPNDLMEHSSRRTPLCSELQFVFGQRTELGRTPTISYLVATPLHPHDMHPGSSNNNLEARLGKTQPLCAPTYTCTGNVISPHVEKDAPAKTYTLHLTCYGSHDLEIRDYTGHVSHRMYFFSKGLTY
jgi:hypothetical protein